MRGISPSFSFSGKYWLTEPYFTTIIQIEENGNNSDDRVFRLSRRGCNPLSPLKKRRLLFGAGTLLIVLGAVMLSGYWATTFPTTPVLKVARDIDRGSALLPELVVQVEVPRGAVPEGALTTLDQIANKWAVSTLLKGEFVSGQRLTDQPPNPADELGKGVGLLSVPVDPAHILGGFLQAGDKVTIYAVPRPERDGASTKAMLAAQDIPVIDVRNSSASPTQASTEGGGLGSISSSSGQTPAWVVLRVPEQEARLIMEAVESRAAVYFYLTARGKAE